VTFKTFIARMRSTTISSHHRLTTFVKLHCLRRISFAAWVQHLLKSNTTCIARCNNYLNNIRYTDSVYRYVFTTCGSLKSMPRRLLHNFRDGTRTPICTSRPFLHEWYPPFPPTFADSTRAVRVTANVL